ncbi:MAG: SpoIIE family protein phosphatase [Planctomycetota bacterium]
MTSENFDPGRTVAAAPSEFLRAIALPHLVVVRGATRMRALPVTTTPVVLGREASRPFHLADADVSRTHCEVQMEGARVFVRDLGSTNGTYVDGVRIEPRGELREGASLRLGRHLLRLEYLGEAEVERENAIAQEFERARAYVAAMFPPALAFDDLRTEAIHVPSSLLGGDGYGHADLGGGRHAFYVLDVCGHGVDSAMHAAAVLHTLRAWTLPGIEPTDPSSVLSCLNDAFSMESHGGMYFTIAYAVLDRATRTLRYATAGHPPILVVGADGALRERLATRNPPIGSFEGRTFAAAETRLLPGDRAYFLSDGVFELTDRTGTPRGLEDFERELLAARGRRTPNELRGLYEATLARTRGSFLEDDFTLLAMELTAAGDP